MNKTMILILAVCLVSAHAFVKRDAPEAPKADNFLENIQKQFGEITKNINEKVSESIDPEAIKKNFNDMVEGVSKAFESLKPKDTPKA